MHTWMVSVASLVMAVAMASAQITLPTPDVINPEVVYAIEYGPVKSIFAVNTSRLTPSIELVYNMSDGVLTEPDFPLACFGYNNDGISLNPISPNGLAFDGQARLYFDAFDEMQGRSRLCYYSFALNKILFVQVLEDSVIGASFSQRLYAYVYFQEGLAGPESRLVLQVANLNRATGQVDKLSSERLFRNITEDSNAPAGELRFTFRGGDLAFDCNEILWASSVGDNGGFKYFFNVDFKQNVGKGAAFDYRLVHSDGINSGGALTGFATHDQLAFDGIGQLISQNSQYGIFSVVNTTTGANGELDEASSMVFYTNGKLRRFTDIASSLDCKVDLSCEMVEGETSCSGVANMLAPTPEGSIDCAPLVESCLVAPACDASLIEECVVYVPF